ncbi:MAG: hypothetical protein JXM69_02310 [Anaerolineae bacterium]|nr:hypothetical protein [Anaerolineae bacterium]
MNRWGCFGLTVGGLTGLLLVMLFLVWMRQMASAPMEPQLAPLPVADVTLSLSESSLSRFATDMLKTPTRIDLEPGGQIEITTRTSLGQWRPVVCLGMSLGMQGADVVSQLRWVQLGFLRIPARWLPQSIINAGALPGQTITQQTPAEFEVVGLQTTSDSIEFQLNWIGP